MGISTSGQINLSWINVQHLGAKGDGVTDDYTAIQSALDLARTNAVTLYFPFGTYMVSQPLSCYSVTLTMEKGATLKAFSDWVTTYGNAAQDPIIIVTNNAIINHMEINGNNVSSGITLGLLGAASEIYVTTIKAYNISANYTGTPAFGVKFTGFNINVKHVEANNGQAGLYFKTVSDVYVNSALLVNNVNGLWIEGCEHIYFGVCDIDSSSGYGIQSFANNDIGFGTTTIWSNVTAYPSLDPTGGVNVDGDSLWTGTIRCIGNTNNTAFTLRNCTHFEVKFVVTNKTLYTTGKTIDVGMDVDTTVDKTNKLEYICQSNITTPLTGSINAEVFTNAEVVYGGMLGSALAAGATMHMPMDVKVSSLTLSQQDCESLVVRDYCVLAAKVQVITNTTTFNSTYTLEDTSGVLSSVNVLAGFTSLIHNISSHPKTIKTRRLFTKVVNGGGGQLINLKSVTVLLPLEAQ